MPHLEWQELEPGIWTAEAGTPAALNLVAAAGAVPRREALAAMGAQPFPLVREEIRWERVGERTVVRLPLEPEEALFGLGLQFMRLNHRGRTRYLRVNSDPRQDTGETHAPVPFYVSSRGYGLLVNTARIVTVCCGSTTRAGSSRPPAVRDRAGDPDWQATPASDGVEIVWSGEGAQVLLFAGPAMLDVVRRYNLLCGGGPIPPRWGLGFWHRVHLRHTDQQVLEEAREYRERGFPCDVIGLEPGWHSKSYPCTYEWSPERFPEPAEFVARMAEQSFRVNLWEHPYVSPEAGMYEALAPLSGSHTVWGGLAPDLTLPAAREVVAEQHDRDHVSIGVSGYKLDECDGSELTRSSWMFPAHARFPSGHDGEQVRQVYGLLIQRLTAGLFRKHDQRTYGLVRASNAGATSFPYVLYSDLYDHRQFVRALCNSGFGGLLWTPEVRTAADSEEWVRRMQVVCFSPLAMVNAWSSSTKPWSFPEVEAIVRRYMELRMRLVPYLYSAFARYHFDGTPPFRAMALELPAGGDPKHPAVNVDDQYLMGDSLLVAPVFSGERFRDVYLPEGAWYDWETGERFEGGRTHRVWPGLDRLPVFARDGAVIPLMPALPHAPAPGEAVPLEVRHYGSAPGRFDLFDDDGETFAYERGQFRWRTLEVTRGPDGTLAGSISPVEDGFLTAYGEVTWRFMG